MELSNIVYSTTLIFILFLFTIFLVGFLGSQYRKFTTGYSERKPDAERSGNFAYSTTHTGGISHQQTTGKPEKRTLFKYTEDLTRKNESIETKIVKVKTVSRGSLVKEHYNARNLSANKKGGDKNGIQFN
jgi:hypothetical protein